MIILRGIMAVLVGLVAIAVVGAGLRDLRAARDPSEPHRASSVFLALFAFAFAAALAVFVAIALFKN
jgi:hypothetical protein